MLVENPIPGKLYSVDYLWKTQRAVPFLTDSYNDGIKPGSLIFFVNEEGSFYKVIYGDRVGLIPTGECQFYDVDKEV